MTADSAPRAAVTKVQVLGACQNARKGIQA